MTQEEWAKTVEWVGVVAGCVIQQDDRYLMVQEKQPKVYGLWNLPAGYVDKDEEVEHAAVREAKEETGYDVKLDGLVGVYHDTTKEPVKHVYRAHIIGGELAVEEDEILDVAWLTYDEIKDLNKEGKLRARFIFEAISSVENS